jgi:hypothetical protein
MSPHVRVPPIRHVSTCMGSPIKHVSTCMYPIKHVFTCMMYTETVCIYLFHKKLEFTNHMGTTYPLHCRYNPNHHVILIFKEN